VAAAVPTVNKATKSKVRPATFNLAPWRDFTTVRTCVRYAYGRFLSNMGGTQGRE